LTDTSISKKSDLTKENEPNKIKEDTSNSKSMSAFNEDGSIKIPPRLIKAAEEEKKSIVLRRVQINIGNPAIANLKIEFPEEVKNPKEIISYYERIRYLRFPSVDHNIKQFDDKTFIVEVKNGSKYMYSLLDYLMTCFESKLANEKKVVIRGNWHKFNS